LISRLKEEEEEEEESVTWVLMNWRRTKRKGE